MSSTSISTLIRCRKCAGWTASKVGEKNPDVLDKFKIRELLVRAGLCVPGRRVPVTEGEVERRPDKHGGGTFIAQCGMWHRMGKKIVALHKEEQKQHEEDKRAFAPR